MWHRHLGYIPQLIYLYDCSIKENIAFGVPYKSIDNTQIDENGIRLSDGQGKRVRIARALFRNPDVLIMDEATATLDNQTERKVTNTIQKAVKDRTVITIAHRLSTI